MPHSYDAQNSRPNMKSQRALEPPWHSPEKQKNYKQTGRKRTHFYAEATNDKRQVRHKISNRRVPQHEVIEIVLNRNW